MADDEFDFDDFSDSDPSESKLVERAHAAFQAQVKKKIKQLSAKDPAKRREAAYWLGESGEPQSITALVRAYKKDKDKSVREAARYALGMFRALDTALKGDEKEQEQVAELIRKIVIKREMGKRLRLPPATLVKVQIGLVVSLVILVLLNVAIPALKGSGSNGGTAAAVPTGVAGNDIPIGMDPLQVLSDIRDRLGKIRSDASALQLQLGAIQTGGKLNCDAQFNDPAPVSGLTPEFQTTYPDIVDIASQLNAARTELVSVKATFDQGCQGEQPLTAADVTTPLETVTNLLKMLTTFDPLIESAETNARTILAGPTETPAPTETPTDTPSPEPTATIAPSVINTQLSELEFIIQQMTESRGANRLLIQYWADARVAGVTDGCRPPYPTIPDDYAPLDQTPLEVMPKLKEAVDQVNLGLNLSRQGWTLFIDGCNKNNLVAQSAAGSTYADTANNAFTSAMDLIDEIRTEMR